MKFGFWLEVGESSEVMKYYVRFWLIYRIYRNQFFLVCNYQVKVVYFDKCFMNKLFLKLNVTQKGVPSWKDICN